MFKHHLAIEQQVEKGKYWIKPGLALEAPYPEHRQHEVVLTKEEIDRITRIEKENQENKRRASYIGPETTWD